MDEVFVPVAHGPHRTGRIQNIPERYNFLMNDSDDVMLIECNKPTSYHEALTESYSKWWLEAMRSEMDSMS
ncbi:hypothetical protein, partial [Escherichia coli]|uniref:hypothetical protein n=1 Tax=Escherichia coli TaxID=562 RepID=UPI003F467465